MRMLETSVLLPIAVSILTVLVLGFTVGPRLAARGKRIQEAHDSRDRFNDTVINILALCINLEAAPVPPDVSDPARSKLQGEGDRWLRQLDEATMWLVDNWQRAALGYAGALGVRDLVARYSASVRGLWLSNRPLEERVRLIRELSEPVQTIFFARRWRVVTKIPSEIERLRALLDDLDNHASSGGST